MPDSDAHTLLKKLQYKDAGPVLALNAPEIFEPVLAATGRQVHRERGDVSCYPVVFVFVASVQEALTLLGPAAEGVCAGGLFWAVYPKGSSKRYASDVSRDSIVAWRPLAERGFEPVRQVAIDDWSALRFRKTADVGRPTRGVATGE